MIRFMQIIVVAILSAAILSGCASTPIRNDYSLDVPASLKDGTYLDKVWFDEDVINKSRYSKILLGSVTGIGVSDQPNITVTQTTQWLRKAIVNQGTTSVVIQSAGNNNTAELELAITELNPGSTVARFFAGEFGAGHAWVQVEGKLTCTKSKQRIGYFIQRSRKSGVLTLRNSRGYDSGPGLIRDIIEGISEDVRKELKIALNI